MTRYAPWNEGRASEIISAHLAEEGPALPILHALQEEFGCIPREAEPLVAHALNITRAEMHGVVTFYHEFRAHPPGRHVLRLCRAEACQSMGGERLAASLLDRLGIDWGETTADGALTVEPVFCLGLCATAPSAMLDERVKGRLTPAKLDHLVAEARGA
ncbi:MAG: formate dehydrogenase subunit gamma [Acetobacteraceae bacterium]